MFIKNSGVIIGKSISITKFLKKDKKSIQFRPDFILI